MNYAYPVMRKKAVTFRVSCLILMLLGAAGPVLAQEDALQLELTVPCSRWNSTQGFLENGGASYAPSILPRITVVKRKIFLGAEMHLGSYRTDFGTYNDTFTGSDDKEYLHKYEDLSLPVVRRDIGFFLGIQTSRNITWALVYKGIHVRADESHPYTMYEFNETSGGWHEIGQADGSPDFRESWDYMGVGCFFILPIYFHRFSLSGQLRYYLWSGKEQHNIIQGEALFNFPLAGSLSFAVGGGFEMVTSSELLGSIWSVTGGLKYRIPL